jgi:glycosyltransferase involved in cell wall biosynthesis
MAARASELAPRCDAAVILDDFAGAYATCLRKAPIVVADKHNVLGWSARFGLRPAGWRNRARRLLGAAITREFERSYLARADIVIVSSDQEADRLQQLYGLAADGIVPSAVEPLLPTPGLREAGTVGWMGALDYGANEQGLIRFVKESWDRLGTEGLRLLVAGRRPSARVRALERHPGVEVLGYVENLPEFLGRLSAAVVPLWMGAGVKLKTLTFMGAGVPLVATPVAVEGLEVASGKHCLVSDDPEGLAEALDTVLRDRGYAAQLGEAGRSLVSQRYTWRVMGNQFTRMIEHAVNGHREAPDEQHLEGGLSVPNGKTVN